MAFRRVLVCALLAARLCAASESSAELPVSHITLSLPEIPLLDIPFSQSHIAVDSLTHPESSDTLSHPASSSSSSAESAASSLSTQSEHSSASASASSASSHAASSASTSSSSAAQPSSTLDSGTQDEIDTMTARRLSFIVGAAGDPSNITAWLSTLGANGQWPASEVDYTTGCDARRANWPAQTHWIRLVTMAAAWHGGLTGANQFVKDPTLLSAIQRAADWWFANDFTDDACLDSGGTASCPCGTPGLWNTNWFSNIILIPNLVAQTCLLLSPSLSPTALPNCTHITTRTYTTLGRSVNQLGVATGANLLDIARVGIDGALLVGNVSQLTDAYRRVHGEAVVQGAVRADGIRADGSFGQHGGVLYNGNYGKDYANDVLLLEIVAGGTEFAAGPNNENAFATLVDGDRWMIYRNVLTKVLHWDFSALGRFISFPVIDAQATGSININITEISQLGALWNSSTLTSVASALASNSSTANVGDVRGNRMFFANDYMVQRGPGYMTSVKMYSNRTKNGECLNDQNPLGFHLSDGTVYTYQSGDEYEDIAAAWDWNLIPGTTVDYNGTLLTCSSGTAGVESFAGGASAGKAGVAAQRYTNPLTRALSWQKAWFFIEGDVQHVMVRILSHNSSSSTHGSTPVFSVLDQKRRNGPVFVDGASVRSSGNFSGATSLWHDGVGYAFPASQKGKAGLSVQLGARTGNWSAIGISTQGVETVDLFAAWLAHNLTSPASPNNNSSFPSISYTAFPAVDRRTFAKKAASAQTQLHEVQNDAHVSAVYDSAHRTAFFVFWDASGGSTSFAPSANAHKVSVAASGNAAVVYCVDTGNVTVSDPSQTLSTLKVTFGTGASNKTLTFALPTGGLAGSSVSQILH
ncbi:polysaccharide lyase family 8 protein [Trametopsis cervina]|nr:polysaccharide lyase family 8 protein [Trametopsis cervina]